MRVQVKLFGSLRLPGVGSLVEVSTHAGATVAHVLEALFQKHPELRPHVVHPERMELLPHVNVMRSGRLVRDLQGLDTAMGEEHVLAIFPPSAGG